MNAASFAGRLDLCLSTLGTCRVDCSGGGAVVVKAIVRRPAEDLSRIVHGQAARELRGVEVRPLRSRP
jgi:hypothetical protein